MKQLTREEADALHKRPDNRMSWIRGVVFGMNVGDIVLIEPKDWKQKRIPKTVINRMRGKNGREWKCETVLNNGGWVIERVR